MKRIGYDADTGRYTFKGGDGSIWEGPEGVEFGQLTRGLFLKWDLDCSMLVYLCMLNLANSVRTGSTCGFWLERP
jgi:hypothetical protein